MPFRLFSVIGILFTLDSAVIKEVNNEDTLMLIIPEGFSPFFAYSGNPRSLMNHFPFDSKTVAFDPEK